MQEVHALQLLDLPIRAGALLVRDENVQQSFGKVADGARGLHVHLAEIRGAREFVKQREQPLVVFEEDLLLHDEHVAERRLAAIEHGIGIGFVIGVARAQNVVHVAQVLQTQMLVGVPVLLEIRESADAAHVVQRRGDHIPAFHGLRDRIVSDAVFRDRAIVDVRIDDFAVIVLLMHGVGEIEIATVVAEAVVVGVFVLPRPILRGQLAIARILGGDVVALIVMQRIRESLRRVHCADLHRQNARGLREHSRLVRRHEDLDIRMLMLLCESHV